MARRQSTSNGVGGRSRAPATPRAIGPAHLTPPPRGQGRANRAGNASARRLAATAPLEEILEFERSRLAHAESVLGCLHVALLHANERRLKDSPDYANAAAIVLGLVKEAADRLDTACVRRALDGLTRQLRVRRPAASRR